VYKEYEPNYDPSQGKYCNRTLYLFAFWLITSVFIVVGVITVFLCCISMATVAAFFIHGDSRGICETVWMYLLDDFE
jgi:hypothetical protein